RGLASFGALLCAEVEHRLNGGLLAVVRKLAALRVCGGLRVRPGEAELARRGVALRADLGESLVELILELREPVGQDHRLIGGRALLEPVLQLKLDARVVEAPG